MTVQSSRLHVPGISALPVREFPYSPAIVPGLVRVIDGFLICIAGLSSLLIFDEEQIFNDYFIFFIIFVTFYYIVIAGYSKLYSINSVMRPLSRGDDVAVSLITAFLFYFSVAFALEAADKFALRPTLCFVASSIFAVMGGRFVVYRLLSKLSERGVIGRSIVVLGVGEQSRRFLQRLVRTKPYFVSVAGVFSDERLGAAEKFEGYPVLGDIDALLAYARERKIDDVVIAMPWNADKRLTELVEMLRELPINVHLSSDLVGFELAFRPVMGYLTEMPMFEVVQRPISGWSSALKACEDYIITAIIIILASPLMLLIAIAIKIDSPGPVFFMQKRLGFNNKEFAIYKFRSMYHQQIPESSVRQASRNDPRVTRVGRLIRATSLDELPQLLNVLNGTMSLVGPRPHAISHNEEYGQRIRGYFARHRVKPGITGWAQVNGLRGETETLEKMEARIRLDIFYAENWSILFDIRILVMTALVVLFQKSAY